MSDDIPIIFALDVEAPQRKPTAVFLSAASEPQMQQYAMAGWTVVAAQGFTALRETNLAKVPAQTMADGDIKNATLVSCEAPHLRADTAQRIAAWDPEIVKINCAFHNVADASSLAESLKSAGYRILAAHWQETSFRQQSLADFAPLAALAAPAWDHLNLIGVRDAGLYHIMSVIGRLYAGEERRIAELQAANAIRGDTIARLEDALIARQPSEIFKLRRS